MRPWSALVRAAGEVRAAHGEAELMACLQRWAGVISGEQSQVGWLPTAQAEPLVRRLEAQEAPCLVDRAPDGSVALGGRLGEGQHFLIGVQFSGTPKGMRDDELLVLAAAARVALLRGDPPDAGALHHLMALLEQSAAVRAATFEADSRLVDTLRDVGQRLTAQLDLDLMVQDATDAATEATGAQFGAFFYNLIDEYGESYTLYTLSGAPREAFAQFPMPRNTKVFAPTFNGECTVRSDDILADPRYGHQEPHYGMPKGHLPVRSYLAVPVISPTSKEVLGGFFFGHSAPAQFTGGHQRLAEGLAGHTAIALDNARLYARERSVATDLQRQMLPTFQATPGFRTVTRYLPAATASEVGGDWLDIIELSSGRTAFVVGDVMGRGVPAAGTMGQIRTAIRAYAMLDLPPSEVLRHSSKLAGEMSGRQFITCIYAVYDPIDQTLTYANAGHPGPAVIAPDGEVSFYEDRLGMPLRLGESFLERVIDFPQGSALVLYTDGLVERRGRPLLDGLADLRLALANLVAGAEDPDAACDEVIKRLTGGAHDDDVALLFARESGEAREVAVMPLTANPLAAAAGRRFAVDTLAKWKLTALQTNASMVVTELVSNAVRHTGAPLALRLQHRAHRLIVEVADGDERQPRQLRPALLDEGHRGLFIVNKLSQRWGTRPTAEGKVVWAELATG
ncbi:hypothetical protein Rhe02_84210 [Rhizocola hellebori]|uniref:GAF domain-containing protein n=1 Tax=Rhizocola hellebori TaxID=1392758 RepID=A0A8J3QIH1_9ACTN|nr:SpoIIE family protein phosphatase [Rhizocola hellebori]GIH10354.1 hypothetical protein Rhe02_84210 [Rhizocola hellebori]